jgi:two-component system nitrogen regulation sensor histidine kinase NtrY
MSRRRLSYERRVIVSALVAVGPLIVAAMALAILGGFDTKTIWTTIAVAAFALFVAIYIVHEQVTFPMRTLSNLIAAIKEGDYSLRAREAGAGNVLGEVFDEINTLSEFLEERKLEAAEAAALLRAVLAEIDAAIFTFDDAAVLQLVSRAGERLIGVPAERIIGRTAAQIGVDDLLRDDASETIDRRFAGGSGRWRVRRSTFREKGRRHRLLVITDITRALREEEIQAWQKLVRVLGHELNNSRADQVDCHEHGQTRGSRAAASGLARRRRERHARDLEPCRFAGAIHARVRATDAIASATPAERQSRGSRATCDQPGAASPDYSLGN